MINESHILGSQTSPPIDSAEDFARSGEKRILTAHLLDTYYSQKSELEELEHTTLDPEEEFRITREMIQNFSTSIRGALILGAPEDTLHTLWAIRGLKQFDRLLESSAQQTRKDLRGVIVFLNDFLSKLYPGKTPEEIAEELNLEDARIADREDVVDLMHYTPEQRKEIIQDKALMLYELRYHWGYYPEATRGLAVHGVRLNDAIDGRRRDLEAEHFNAELNRGFNLDRIWQRMRQEKASKGEMALYSLWRNKITGNYTGAVAGSIHLLRSLGPEFEEFYEQASQLAAHFVQYRAAMTKRAAETGTTEGFIPFGDKKFSDAMRNDIRQTELLIERVFMALYPSTKKTLKDGRGIFDKKELEKKLGIKH